jgi:hypothetical protein
MSKYSYVRAGTAKPHNSYTSMRLGNGDVAGPPRASGWENIEKAKTTRFLKMEYSQGLSVAK